jgi:hypothetical protein
MRLCVIAPKLPQSGWTVDGSVRFEVLRAVDYEECSLLAYNAVWFLLITANVVCSSLILFALMRETTISSGTTFLTKATRWLISEDAIDEGFHSWTPKTVSHENFIGNVSNLWLSYSFWFVLEFSLRVIYINSRFHAQDTLWNQITFRLEQFVMRLSVKEILQVKLLRRTNTRDRFHIQVSSLRNRYHMVSHIVANTMVFFAACVGC